VEEENDGSFGVVSGGGTGMGRATVRAFALDGERVLILGRRAEVLADTAEKLNAKVGAEHVTWRRADLSEPEHVELVVDGIEAVDVVVNNAGGVDRPGGRIVNISSIAALRGGGDSYSAAKAALIGWTYHLAATLGP
jgi:3-oxoacyl-[acyl-carrier protein] reductase